MISLQQRAGWGGCWNRFRKALLHSCCSRIDFGSGFPGLLGSDPASPLGARVLVAAARSLKSLVSGWELVSVSASAQRVDSTVTVRSR